MAGVTMPFDMRKHTIVLNCDDAFQYDLFTLDDNLLQKMLDVRIYTMCIKCMHLNLNLRDLDYSRNRVRLVYGSK